MPRYLRLFVGTLFVAWLCCFSLLVDAQFYLPPSGPDLRVTPTGTNTTGSYSVSWTRLSAVPNYILQERDSSGQWRTVYTALSGSATSYSVSGKAPGTYEYRASSCTYNFQCSPYGLVLRVVVTLPAVSTPVLSPNGGTHSGSALVSITSATPGATIRYTTNNAAVTASSPVYSAPFTLTASATVRARAFKTEMTNSAEINRVFTINQPPAAPNISPKGGAFSGGISINISSPDASVTLRYTTNNTAVTTSSPVFSAPLTLTANTTIRARAFKVGAPPGHEVIAHFSINPGGAVVTEYTYDALGRLIDVEDSNNTLKMYEYDSAGNRKEVLKSH